MAKLRRKAKPVKSQSVPKKRGRPKKIDKLKKIRKRGRPKKPAPSFPGKEPKMPQPILPSEVY